MKEENIIDSSRNPSELRGLCRQKAQAFARAIES